MKKKPAISLVEPSVQYNIKKFQLEKILDLAKKGGYGRRSKQVLNYAKEELKEMMK